MRILISGASGFVGAPLSNYLASKGHEVVPLSRNSSQKSIYWDPERKLIPIQFLEDFDAVIHLAGEPLSFSRWTDKKKDKIARSRIDGTSFLSDTLATLDTPPKVLISASAVGFYGDRGDELLDENSCFGTGFLSSVCKAWEAATDSLRDQGVRVVNTRFGIVMGNGGFLRRVSLLYKFGLGAILGTGLQWMSWIAMDDLIGAIDHVLNCNVEGAVNFVSPNPLRQEELSHILANHYRRPHFLKIPRFILKLLLGDASNELILASTRVNPSKLLNSGFTFKCSKLEDIDF